MEGCIPMEFQEVCKIFMRRCMICPLKWELQSLEIIEDLSQVQNTFLTVFSPCHEGTNLAAGKSFNPSREHTRKNKNILVTHTWWPLKKIQLQVFKVSRGRRSEAPGNKNSFSRIMDVTSQTWLVDCFLPYSRSLSTNIHL